MTNDLFLKDPVRYMREWGRKTLHKLLLNAVRGDKKLYKLLCKYGFRRELQIYEIWKDSLFKNQ